MILAYQGKHPAIHPTAYIAPNATIIGDVTIAAGANIWFGAVLRGDKGAIVIGERTTVQDNAVIHVNHRHNTLIGADVVVGHGAVLEGCQIGDRSLVGMNATVLDGAMVGQECLIAAGAVVTEGMVVAEGMLMAGVPARFKALLTPEMKQRILHGVAEYQQLLPDYWNSSSPQDFSKVACATTA